MTAEPVTGERTWGQLWHELGENVCVGSHSWGMIHSEVRPGVGVLWKAVDLGRTSKLGQTRENG